MDGSWQGGTENWEDEAAIAELETQTEWWSALNYQDIVWLFDLGVRP